MSCVRARWPSSFRGSCASTTAAPSAAAWRVPVDYFGDSWQTLGHPEGGRRGPPGAAAGGNHAELGAPFNTSWTRFPPPAQAAVPPGRRPRARGGTYQQRTFLVPLAAALAAASFYFVCRYSRARPEWALAGATAFALSPYLFYRGLNHLTLTFYWPLPLAVLVVTWAFGRRDLVLRSRRFAAAIAIVIVAGVHNIYYAGLLAHSGRRFA